jgi:SAM-dependent methyltransferase
MTTSTSHPAPRDAARAIWAAGDYGAIAPNIALVGLRAVRYAGVRSGEAVLDVACGTGNASLPAARAGARVTGLDLTPELLARARALAAGEGLDVAFVEGDAEALPFEDASFDRVLSSFGVMFAPRHEVAAAELARVCAPGGMVVLASWMPDGTTGQMFKFAAAHMPPPPPFASPAVLWGNPGHVMDLLEPHGLDVHSEPRVTYFPGDSVDHVVQRMEDYFGPWQMLKASVGAEKWPEVRAGLTEIYARANESAEGEPARVQAEYLLTVARKPA